MKAFSNHSVGISRSQERCSVKLESAAISSRGPVDGPPLVSYIFVPTRLTVQSIFWIKRHGDETGEYEAVTLVARSKSRCCTGNVSGRRND